MQRFHLLITTIILAVCANAQPEQEVLSKLKFRSIGPAFTTGRIADIAKDPSNPSTWYVAVASANVWKTTNNGTKPRTDRPDLLDTMRGGSGLECQLWPPMTVVRGSFPQWVNRRQRVINGH